MNKIRKGSKLNYSPFFVINNNFNLRNELANQLL